MAQVLNPFSGRQFLDSNGDPYNAALLFIYSAGSTTKVTTTQDLAATTNHANPIVLNARGEPADGAGASQAIWQASGTTVKMVLAPANDTDPPVSAISTWDDIAGVNDTVLTIDEWVSGPTPTFIDTTNFSLVGDQTTIFHVGRRLKFSETAGTVYGTITVSAYTTLTTITVALDSGTLDSGLSAVSYGILAASNVSNPADVLTTEGDILYRDSVRNNRLAKGLAGQILVASAGLNPIPSYWVPRNYTEGLILTKDTDATNDINITAGDCADSTNGYILKLTAEMTKRIDATWAAGDDAGGMFTGSVADSTLYYMHLIRKDSDGTIDAGFDTSITAANIPSGYTSYRKIGSIYRDANSANVNIVYNLDAITETGEWTPTIQDSSFSDAEGQTYLTQLGEYTKVGRHISILGRLVVNDTSPLTSSDPAYIAGFPYLSAANNLGALYVGYAESLALTAAQNVTGIFNNSQSYASLYVWDIAAGTSQLTVGEVSITGGLQFQGAYITS